MSDIKIVEHEHHSSCFHVLRGAEYVGSGGKKFCIFDYEGFSAQELRAIADELDKRNGVKCETDS